MTAIAIRHRAQIIERVAKGEYLQSIAQSLGLKGKGQSISDYLAKDPEYREARVMGHEAKLANRERELELAEPQDVPRARELLSHARWRAERECPERWGQRNQQVSYSESMSDLLMAVSAKMLRDSNKPAQEAIDITPIADK